MMKRKGLKKLVLSCCMCGAAALSLFSSTFAFVVLNQEANISEFGFNIENQEGLLISVDGLNFSQDLNYTQITSIIERNANVGLTSADEGYVKYEDLRYTGVTLDYKELSDKTNGVKFESYKYKIGNVGAEISDYKPVFVKDSLELDLIADPESNNDIYYKHINTAAAAKDYVFFDLWFKIATNGQETSKYELKLTDRTSITGDTNTVKLDNSLTTTGIEDDRNGNRDRTAYGLTTGDADLPYENGEYIALDTLTVNPADAMRLAIVTQIDKTKDQFKDEERDANIFVYEPNLGLGSVALEGIKTPAGYDSTTYDAEDHYAYNYSDLSVYNPYLDPFKNAMYTYYNSTHPLSLYQAGATYHEGFKTKKEVTNDVLATFEVDSKTKVYNTVKLSVMVWLEGWDADYIMGVTANDVLVKLGFEAVEVE